MKRILAILVAAAALAGCASAPKAPPPALVPVTVGCKSAQEPLPARPAAPMPDMSAWSNKQKAIAISANHKEWIGYGDALRNKLEACK